MLSDEDQQRASVIFELIRGATSQELVREFLRGKGIAVSAKNWEDLYTRRIRPALEDSLLSLSDIRGLLREVEENGRQHIFLYSCARDRATAMMDRGRVESLAADAGLLDVMTDPLDVALPEDATIVDIRYEPAADNFPRSLIVKQVESRSTQKFVGERFDAVAGLVIREYSREKKRAVNLARIYENGLFEIRIASQDNSTRYHDNLNRFFAAVRNFFPRDEFSEISLQRAKGRIWNDRAALAGEIRYGRSEAKNDFGFTMSVNAPTLDDNLTADTGSAAALESFLVEDGRVVETNIHIKVSGPGEDERYLHLLISGEVNEFAVPVACSARDLNYVRGKIQSFNS